MATLNENIISEINSIQETDVKDFLKWLMDFERERSDRVKFHYKNDINDKLERMTID